MNSRNGFTLLEVLFVLAIWSVLLILSAPLNFTILEKHREKSFIDTFEMDLLYMQNMSYASRDYFRLTFPDNKSYIIKKDFSSDNVVERIVPEGWQIQNRTMPTISFNKKGTITQPGNFVIKTLLNEYRIVCPLGKGRCYIVKQ